MVLFGRRQTDQYFMKAEVEEAARTAIIQALKDGLPEEARRVDVLCYLLDETKEWVKTRRINL